MSNFSKTAWNVLTDLPPWAKGVVAIGGLVIVTVAGLTIYKKVSKGLSGIKEGKFEKDPVDLAKTDLSGLAKKGIKPSFTDQQYSSWAEKIQNSFGGCDATSILGISVSAIALKGVIVQMKNDADFLKLVEAFGVRKIDGCFSDGEKMNLYTAVADELNVGEIAMINFALPKGITYKF